MHVQVHVRAKLLPSRLTLCDPVNCSPPGSSVHGILQARILGWVLLQGIFQTHGPNLGLLRCQADSLLSKPLGSATPPPPLPNPCNAMTKSFKWRQESQCQRERNKPAFPGFEAERGHEPRDFGRLQVLSWILSSINGFSPRASGISLPRLESWLYL